MKIVSRTSEKKTTAGELSPRTYFVHIPKTAGITLKAYLENNYTYGQSLVINEWEARQLSSEELRQYRLLSGHYSSEVLDALGERPDVTLMMVREPVGRFRSWLAHCRRLSNSKYRTMCEGRTDREVLTGPDGYTCHQAHWLARAVRDGSDYTGVPSAAELEVLLDRVDITGMTEEIDRFKQLVAFRMGWPAPQLSWHINRRPDESTTAEPVPSDGLTDDELLEHLAIDRAFYQAVQRRFWSTYADMLSTIADPAATFTLEMAAGVSIGTVQAWLRRYHEERAARRMPSPVDAVTIDSGDPVAGEGWWWREHPRQLSYRWSGPGDRATLLAAPLVEDQDYVLTVDAMGAADWPTWEGIGIEVNGRPVDTVHERFAPRQAASVAITMRARLTPDIVAAQRGVTRITIVSPGTKQSLSHVLIKESFDTVHKDMRAVGLAVQSVRIERIAACVAPTLSVRRPSAA